MKALAGGLLPMALLIASGLTFAAGEVHYEPGLVTGSVIQDDMDYEALTMLKAVSPQGATVAVHWVRVDGGKKIESSAPMTTRAEDRQKSRRLIVTWVPGDSETIPGATWGSFSQLVLQELKGQGKSSVVLGAARGAKPGDVIGGLMAARKYYRGTLERVGTGTVPFSVLLDGKRTMLQAIHAKGKLSVGSDSTDAEFWILDDADHPLTLRWSALGSNVTMVRIENPQSRDAHGHAGGGGIDLGSALGSNRCRAELHGVFFNTGSATLLPESKPALERVAALLTANPAWQVTLEGHTDNIGDAAYNQNLSVARANAVRDALLKQLSVPADRLKAAGFGATKPVETNATVEGRAHNRRVELARKCS